MIIINHIGSCSLSLAKDRQDKLIIGITAERIRLVQVMLYKYIDTITYIQIHTYKYIHTTTYIQLQVVIVL